MNYYLVAIDCRYLAKDRKQKQYLVETILPVMPILEYDDKAAKWHALERARLSGIGLTPAFADGQIAAIASANQLILVTRISKDFINFESLTIENWFESIG